MARRGAISWAALAVALFVCTSTDAQETILDPENPGVRNESQNEQTPPSNSGLIMDPENPGVRAETQSEQRQPSNSGLIMDPENPGSLPPEMPRERAANTTPAPARPTIFRGELSSESSVDFAHERTDEETLRIVKEMSARIRHPLGSWNFVAEGRLSWWMSGGGAADRSVLAPERDRWEADVEAELRDFYLAGRAGDWLFVAGQQAIVWGSSDIMRPADFISPRDLRRGLLQGADDARIPIPALSATRILGDSAIQGVLVPFFYAHRFDIYGSDNALLRPGSPLGVAGGIATSLRALIDPSIDGLVQPAIAQTERPAPLPKNASAGLRFTTSLRGLDLGIGYFYGWDRTPVVDVHPGFRPLLDTVGDAAGLLSSDPAALLSLIGDLEVLAPDLYRAIEDGETLYRTSYERQHAVEVDFTRYFGPIGVRAESVLFAPQTAITDDLESIRRPALFSTLGLSHEGRGGDVVFVIEGFYRHHFVSSDTELTLFGPRHGGVATALRWSLATVNARRLRVGDLSVELAAVYMAPGDDLLVAPMLRFAISESLSVSAAATITASLDRSRATLGDLVEDNDAFSFRLEHVF